MYGVHQHFEAPRRLQVALGGRAMADKQNLFQIIQRGSTRQLKKLVGSLSQCGHEQTEGVRGSLQLKLQQYPRCKIFKLSGAQC